MMKLKLPKTKRQTLADRESKISDFISISHLNTPHIFETKQGSLGAVIEFDGVSFEMTDIETLNWYQRIIANFITSLSDEFAIYITMHRYKHNTFPSSTFLEEFAQNFNDAYLSNFRKKSLYLNKYYLTLVIKGPHNKISKGIYWLSRLSHKAIKDELSLFREKQQQKLNTVILDALKFFESFSPSLLGEIEAPNGKTSKLLSFLGLLINGEYQDFLYPKQDLSTYIPYKRIFFGYNTIEWQGNSAKDKKLAAILSLKNYCPESSHPMLDDLLKVDCEYLMTQTFLRQDNQSTLKNIEKQAKHLEDAEDKALSQQDELTDAMDLVASSKLVFGEHHNTLLIFADSKEELEDKITHFTKIYRNADLVLIRETLNLESAFWSQIPGNFQFIRRKSLISSDNFADFCPLHNYNHGYFDKNHLGGAVTLLESSSQTSLYFNFHEKASGKKNDLSKGHTTIIAPSNAGKTTLMLALDCQAKRYQTTSIFFDRDQGCEIYVRAMDGFYTRISPDQPTGFNPLALLDNEKNRSFLKQWLESLLETSGQLISDEEKKIVGEVIDRNYTLPFEQRKLSIISHFFPANFPKKDALLPWLQSSHKDQPRGRLAYLFDNEIDELSLNKKTMGFDMTYLLDHESKDVISSVMMYLFHRIEALMDGQLIGIYLDEGWQLLENDYWSLKMRQYLATLRKLNTYLVFATQSPHTVAVSKLRAPLIEGSATNIFLPNPKAEMNDYCEGFKLTSREFEFIKYVQDRRFLIKQGHETAIGRLNLTGLEDFIAVFSANKTTINLLDEIRNQHGDDPSIWLPIFQARRPH